ncbi:MAG: hypothetical protein AAB520_00805 [Patescibacteria group bacterium]
MKKETPEEFQWDRKRILIAIFLLVAGLIVAFELKGTFIKNKASLGDAIRNKPVEVKRPEIKSPNIDISSKVDAKIEDIKNNVGGLDPAEVATSSPQIQKVLRDIQEIKNLPVDQAKQTCMKICSGI